MALAFTTTLRSAHLPNSACKQLLLVYVIAPLVTTLISSSVTSLYPVPSMLYLETIVASFTVS